MIPEKSMITKYKLDAKHDFSKLSFIKELNNVKYLDDFENI